MPVIRVDDEVYQWLQEMAQPFVDTPNSVLRRLMEREVPKPLLVPTTQPVSLKSTASEGVDPVDELTRELKERLVADLRSETGCSSIVAWWQPGGLRYSLGLYTRKDVFANLHRFQPRKNRARIEVPEYLLVKAGVSLAMFDQDHHWPKGWYGVSPSDLLDIGYDGQNWNQAEYQQALGILVRIARVR